MRRVLALLLCALSSGCGGSDLANGDGDGGTPPPADGDVPTWHYRVVNVFAHDSLAWTQGLVYADGFLYEGTGGGAKLTSHPGLSSLRKVELESGTVLEQATLDARYFGEGIALLGDRLYQLTWQERTAFLYERAGLARVGQFAYPTEGWGLTTDGTDLWMSDGTATLYRRDPTTFAEVGRLQVHHRGRPVARLNELEWVGGQVWANVWQTEVVARIDPASGAVVGWIDLSGLLEYAGVVGAERRQTDVLNGIAYDSATARIFVTGKLWPWLFEIELVR